MTGQSGVPLPKPPKGTRKKLKAKAQREDYRALKGFIDRVWLRERVPGYQMWAHCQHCGHSVCRERHSDSPFIGEVHHKIGRRAKATRYDPDNGVLLCRECHGKVTRHEVTL